MGHAEEDGVAPAAARLEVVSGPLKGKQFSLPDSEISIGRDPSNEISLLDSLVSRRHCVVRKEGAAFRVQDLDSRNNTFVSGVPIRDRVLAHGDQIRIGNSILRIQAADGGPVAATPRSAWTRHPRPAQQQ